MAALYPSHETPMDWTAAEWSVADDNAKNHVAPVDGDSVVFTANSAGGAGGIILLDADQAAVELAGMDLTGFLGKLEDAAAPAGQKIIDVDGNVVLDGIVSQDANFLIECSGDLTLTAGMTATDLQVELNGTGTVTSNSVVLGDLTINTAGTHTLFNGVTGDLSCANFTMTAGTLNMNSRPAAVTGALDMQAGTLASGGTLTHFGTNNAIVDGVVMADYVLGAGALITRTGVVQCLKCTIPADATLAATGATDYLYIPQPANDFFECLGAVTTGTIRVRISPARSNSKDILCTAATLSIMGNDALLTQTGKVTVATLRLRGYSNNSYGGVIFAGGSPHDLGAVELGVAAAALRYGRVEFGDNIFTIASMADVGGAALHQVDWGSAYITQASAGTVDGTGVGTWACDGATLVNGKIRDADLTGTATPLTHIWPTGVGVNTVNINEYDLRGWAGRANRG